MMNIRCKAVIIRWCVAVATACVVQSSLASGTEDSEPLKVFILAGQSNMQGHAQVRTMASMAGRPGAQELHGLMVNDDGSPRVCERVWISSIGCAPEEQVGVLTAGFGASGRGPKIGPEFTFGLTMERLVDAPILIIKTSWGGKSLHTDFRPPSAGVYEFSDAERDRLSSQGKDVGAEQKARAEASGHHYRLMMDHVRTVLADPSRVVPGYDRNAGFELAGFVWFQGWNDMVDGGVYPDRGKPGGYDAYADLMAQFIREVRSDLNAHELPFVIGVMGVGGPTDRYTKDQLRYRDVHQNFRDAMAAPASLPEFEDSVVAVQTGSCWDMEVKMLREREKTLKPDVDAIRGTVETGTTTRAEAEALIDELYQEHFNAQELVILRDSVSNAEYHYLGSALILGRIGQAFAEALEPFVK